MTSLKQWVLGLALGGLAVVGTLAQNSPAPPEYGLKVGEKAIEFQLKDLAGQEKTLADFLKKGPVVLLFYRSADW